MGVTLLLTVYQGIKLGRRRGMNGKENECIGGWAPGNYYFECTICKGEFTGDKKAYQCKPCAEELKEKEEKMSANICYEVIKEKPNMISTPTPSRFIEVIEKIFGSMPCVITQNDFAVVSALAIADSQFEEFSEILHRQAPVRIGAQF